jgi:hypothetical protein
MSDQPVRGSCPGAALHKQVWAFIAGIECAAAISAGRGWSRARTRPCRRHRRVAAPWHCDRPSGSLLSDRQRRPLRLASGLGPQAPRLRRPRLRLRTGQQLSPRCSYVEASPPPD